jgi:hypothetical protein
MVVRIWRTEIDVTRARDYWDFAQSRSLPMFRTQPGFAGVMFAAHGAERAVITLWHDRAAAEALDHSPSYTPPGADPAPTGLLRGDSAVEVLELEGLFMDWTATS